MSFAHANDSRSLKDTVLGKFQALLKLFAGRGKDDESGLIDCLDTTNLFNHLNRLVEDSIQEVELLQFLSVKRWWHEEE